MIVCSARLGLRRSPWRGLYGPRAAGGGRNHNTRRLFMLGKLLGLPRAVVLAVALAAALVLPGSAAADI